VYFDNYKNKVDHFEFFPKYIYMAMEEPIILIIIFQKKKKKKGEKSKPHPPLTAMGGWPATNGSGGGATTPGAIWGWHRPPPILIGDFDCIPINVY
jgi:hypothetical protein